MMKKLFTLFLSVVMLLTACASLIGCGGHSHTYGEWVKTQTHHWKECTDETCSEKSEYGPHSFTNGACVCGARNLTVQTVNSNTDESKSLNEVKAGTSDIAIVDQYIYNHYSANRSSICDGLSVLNIDGVNSPEQQFRFITKKDSDIGEYFNAALYKLQEEGIYDKIRLEEKTWTLADLAEKYNLGDLLIEIPEPTVDLDNIDPDSDLAAMRLAPEAKIHFTIPSGKPWIEPLGWQTQAAIEGFMIYVAQAALQILGLDVSQTFSPADMVSWDQAYQINYTEDFTDYQIICGIITDDMTYYDPLTEETVAITDMFDLSVPYMKNKQVLVAKTEKVATYNSLASLASATIVTEVNFAGYDFATNQLKNAIMGA